MSGSFSIGRVGGIQIRLHFTFLLVLPFIALGFARAFEGFRYAAMMAGVPPELVRGSPFLWGTLIALGLFASVLVHELAHARFAISKGGKVRDITLLMIGGVSNIAELPREPKYEALMALVGPVTSILLAGVLYLAYLLLGGTAFFSFRFGTFYLAAMNLFLGLFNLLPAFPMDGGRILRGLLATRMGVVRATQVAATCGKAFALLFLVVSFFTFNFFLMLIAFFVYVGAEAEARQVVAQSVLGQIRVKDLLRPVPALVDLSATVEEAADRLIRTRQLALPVARGDGIAGVVTLDDVEKVPPEGRTTTSVRDVLRAAPPVSADANVWDALRQMSESGLPLVPVLEGGRIAGVLDHEDVVRSLRLHQLQRRPIAPRMVPSERSA